jgi:hypothetical protein
MTRRLLTTRRHVPLDQSDDYLGAWESVRRAVEAMGARAWIFRGAAHEDQFLEFLEWASGSPVPHEDEAVAALRAQLDTFAAPGLTEDWEEAL